MQNEMIPTSVERVQVSSIPRSSQSDQCLLRTLAVLEEVCQNKDILELLQDSPEWTNALNDCISLAKKVARRVETARFLGENDWSRFMDVICSESKVPEMLPDCVYILNVSLQSETVLSMVSCGPEFYDCLTALSRLAESIEEDHRSGVCLGERLWKELRLAVRQNASVLQVLASVPESGPAISPYKERLLNMPLEEKRKLYACKAFFASLSSIPSWQESAPRSGLVTEDEDLLYPVDGAMNEKVSLFVGDITTLEIDAIVNSVDSDHLTSGEVDEFIHRAAGPALIAECQALGSIEMGKAKITGGYLLPARYVIHAVGPEGKNAEELQSCYKHCLKIVLENGLRTIAFPCISTGAKGYPNEKAAIVALKTVREFLQDEENLHKVDRIIFCVLTPVDVSTYKDFLHVYFPV